MSIPSRQWLRVVLVWPYWAICRCVRMQRFDKHYSWELAALSSPLFPLPLRAVALGWAILLGIITLLILGWECLRGSKT